MGGTRKGNCGDGRRIDDVAKGTFLLALKRGARVRAAAEAAGFSTSAFYEARKRDSAFAEAWAEALEISAAPRFIAPSNGRKLQLRRSRWLLFTDKRRELFLSHFAGTCDLVAAAEAAGVSVSTVNRHRSKDPDFAAAFDAALRQGYEWLEAELLRQSIEAQRKLAEGIIPAGERHVEFEKGMKLLARWERRDGSVGPKSYGPGKLKRWTFDDAMAVLEKKLTALGYRAEEGNLVEAGEEAPPPSCGRSPSPGNRGEDL